jgi:hypothetical protein
MERSTYLAKLIGPVFIAGGLGMLFNTAIYRAMFEHALHDHILIYLSGILALLAGLAIVAAHNEWKWHWSLIITLLGWCAIIGGAVRMIAPQVIESVGMSFLTYPNFFMIDGVVAVLLGVLLSYFGYFAPRGRTARKRGRR